MAAHHQTEQAAKPAARRACAAVPSPSPHGARHGGQAAIVYGPGSVLAGLKCQTDESPESIGERCAAFRLTASEPTD
jgi:hypothetical protein